MHRYVLLDTSDRVLGVLEKRLGFKRRIGVSQQLLEVLLEPLSRFGCRLLRINLAALWIEAVSHSRRCAV